MAAIIEAWRAGLLRRDNWIQNITAGIVVGVVSIPLSMAFAIASGAKPEQGLYTAIVAALAVSLFGGTRVQIAGPTGAFAVLLFGVTAKYGIAGLQVATALAGIMLLLFGLTKLGGVIRFIPEPVILGFTAGVAVLIWVGQWQSFFGLPKVAGEHFHEKLLALIAALPHLHVATALLGLASMAIIVLWPRIPALGKVPGPLVALMIATLLQSTLHIEGVATIGSAFGGIPRGLPSFALPLLPFGTVLELLRPAFAIALLGAVESLLSATVVDGMTGYRHDSNQELIGQGIANIGAALFGGFAATGAIARTATNVRHGGNSPVAGIASSVTLLLTVLVLAPLAYNVPLTTLAAVLFVVAFNMSEAGRVVRTVKRAPKADVAIMLITLTLTVFTDLIVAVNVGVILAMLNFMRRMSSSVETRALGAQEVADQLPQSNSQPLPEGVLVYTIEGPFFFGAVQQFEAALEHTHTEPTALVISLERVPFIDLTGILALKDVIEASRKRGVDVRLCCANELVTGKLERAGIADLVTVPVSAPMAEALGLACPVPTHSG
ncbi:MAG: sodium-independent anion transporter [Actinobacteria bacterium HGW-Actinobacteria-1]|jgi:SulP family sulfate permease|nr:MAG: sodium-independent anion transporter [Actinobacteria bacterium HGW-Actinobacteria-1]